MTIRISMTHNEKTGDPAFIDVHHRSPGGAVTPQPIKTHTLQPGESQTLCVYSAQVLVVREAPEILHGDGF
jgi:hypothetical protein